MTPSSTRLIHEPILRVGARQWSRIVLTFARPKLRCWHSPPPISVTYWSRDGLRMRLAEFLSQSACSSAAWFPYFRYRNHLCIENYLLADHRTAFWNVFSFRCFSKLETKRNTEIAEIENSKLQATLTVKYVKVLSFRVASSPERTSRSFAVDPTGDSAARLYPTNNFYTPKGIGQWSLD